MKYDERVQEILEYLQHAIAAGELRESDPQAIAAAIRKKSATVLSDVEVLRILRKLRHDVQGVGILEPIFSIPGLTDVVVNGKDHIFYDRGQGMERFPLHFETEEDVRRLATRLILSAGSRLDESQCFANGVLERLDGTNIRIHAVLSPPAQAGTCLSLRVLRQVSVSLEELAQQQTFQQDTVALLRRIIAKRHSFLIIGGTGSGKTTLLSAMLGEVPAQERLIVLEDTAELQPNHPHVLTMVTRGANTEGKGAIVLSDLLQQSLRMRPDRIIVGEIRGPEVIDLLTALNTGHEGCAGTLHANDVREVPARIEALAALGNMGRETVLAQLAAAAPLILVMKRTATGRRLHQIGMIDSFPPQVQVVWSHKTGPTSQLMKVLA
ncbi:TadA family conjugal transfer-associated ATPase [Corynebacterium sp. HS2168-gen11]|uniref:TadA family conjugal transfer-associated ATPase n=1 Tax=Corynebacterium sp. HS2168-gen11 TaxID=2974027 RepID=UPI00216AF08F|nr:TadA family conjugal transfer-associated ATPase [Corynebacterium sp. HS2168-gen11]MCS4535936.1 TadA family conjugal transfer-associated ATPase [Corynebacterium sp. HS2168-gen11]